MTRQQTTLSIWCERIIEAGWLLALTLIPIYFNLLSARHFEPDKATTLRSLVLVMAAFALIRALEQFNSGAAAKSTASAPPALAPPTAANPFATLWNWLNQTPMALPVVVYVIIFILSTITSIVPHTSLWGSYQRLQGTYTNLSYILLAVLMVLHLRCREQLERLITIVLVTGFMVSFYGVVQHAGFDPLPWKGDVVQRVASTMGNAIFVAAYLVILVPLALYRSIKGIGEIKNAPSSTNPTADVLWAGAYASLIVGTMTLLVSAIKFGATVQAADFRYWWVFPGAVVVSTGLWIMLTLGLQHRTKLPPFTPGMLFGAYVLLLVPMFVISAGGDKQQVNPNLNQGVPWWGWLMISVGAVVVFYALAFFLPRATATPSRLNRGLTLLGTIAVLFSMLLTIIYSQSRGPWLGLAVGMFIFVLFFLITIEHRFRQATSRALTSEKNVLFSFLADATKVLLWGWILTALAGISFILMLNFSQAAFIKDLRSISYFQRMSTLFETQYGTGVVRRLIWTGDEFAGGTIGLITADPFRTVVGWGPESMFVAFNPFYPPSLAHVEARTASPDRAHQAVLDQLVTRGVLGLISYFFLLISFALLAWQIMWKSNDWQWQLLAIAALSMVTTHVIEGMTGIPIVSTLTMLWTTFAITVIAGRFANLYTLTKEDATEQTVKQALAAVEPAPAGAVAMHTSGVAETPADNPPDDTQATLADAESATPTTQPLTTTSKNKRRKSGQAQGAKQAQNMVSRSTTTNSSRTGRTAPNSSSRRQPAATSSRTTRTTTTSLPAYAFYALLLLLTFGAVWKLNISIVYADMRFHEGETFSNIPNAGINEQVYALDKFLESIRQTPKEDFYYLNLGRSLMSLAELKRSNGIADGEEREVDVADLFRYQGIEEVAGFVQQETPMGLMSYARAVLKQAYDLNPMNKDHSANLARLHNFWFNWTQDPEKLRIATEWYEKANTVAPFDVALINESAGVHVMYSTLLSSLGNQDEALGYKQKAEDLYKTSMHYDPLFSDADTRLAELYRQDSRIKEAGELYVQAIKRDPHQFDEQVETLAQVFEDYPELLRAIRDTYEEKAAGDKPDNKDSRLYAIAGLLSVRLGDMERAADAYDQAVELDPENVGNRKNYTIILSDTQRYNQALTQATVALSLTRQAEPPDEQEIQQLQYLIALLEESLARAESDTQ